MQITTVKHSYSTGIHNKILLIKYKQVRFRNVLPKEETVP